MLDVLGEVLPVLVIAAFLAINALFVAAEFAIVAAPRAAIKRHAEEGRRRARLVEWVQRDANRQDRFIATAQLGITAASLGLGMYGERVLADWIREGLAEIGVASLIATHGLASAVALTLLTYLHIVLGEMVPKSIALTHAQRVALWIGPLMRAVQLALYPVVVGLNAVGNGLLRALGIDRRQPSGELVSTPEDLAHIVRESQESGELRHGPAQVLRELLEFGDLTAAEVMVPRVKVTGIALGATSEAMREILAEAPHTRYPVYDGSLDQVVGMVHVKDLLRLLPRGLALGTSEVRALPFVPETTLMDQLVAALRASRSQMAIVMDEHGGTAGLITIEDLFEEVVGEITEDTTEPREMWRDPEGHVHVAGTVRIDEVGEELGVSLEYEDVDTVSGLVLALLGGPAEVGDTVTWQEVRFVVTAVAGHGVEECIVSVLPPEPSPDAEPESEAKPEPGAEAEAVSTHGDETTAEGDVRHTAEEGTSGAVPRRGRGGGQAGGTGGAPGPGGAAG